MGGVAPSGRTSIGAPLIGETHDCLDDLCALRNLYHSQMEKKYES